MILFVLKPGIKAARLGSGWEMGWGSSPAVGMLEAVSVQVWKRRGVMQTPLLRFPCRHWKMGNFSP